MHDNIVITIFKNIYKVVNRNYIFLTFYKILKYIKL